MSTPKIMTAEEAAAFRAAMEHIYGKKKFVKSTNRKTNQTHDENGQPLNLRFQEKAVSEREMNELIGLLKGILSDNSLVESEVRFLSGWLNSNTFASNSWPGSALKERIQRALTDDLIDKDELSEIRGIITSIIGGGEIQAGSPPKTTDLPIDRPAPLISFQGKTFCFTGKLLWGSRNDAQSAVLNRGGKITSPSKSLDFLVLGEFSSRDWKHSTHGMKILDAVYLKENGASLFIVSERDWSSALDANPPVTE